MNINTNRAYVFQPLPPQPDGKYYAVCGLEVFGFSVDGSCIEGLTKRTAEEIARICNESPEFAASFIRGIKSTVNSQ